ncbi:MAG: hypothetical protein ACPGXY_05055 [Alphaproteobacteria bacterium]
MLSRIYVMILCCCWVAAAHSSKEDQFSKILEAEAQNNSKNLEQAVSRLEELGVTEYPLHIARALGVGRCKTSFDHLENGVYSPELRTRATKGVNLLNTMFDMAKLEARNDCTILAATATYLGRFSLAKKVWEHIRTKFGNFETRHHFSFMRFLWLQALYKPVEFKEGQGTYKKTFEHLAGHACLLYQNKHLFSDDQKVQLAMYLAYGHAFEKVKAIESSIRERLHSPSSMLRMMYALNMVDPAGKQQLFYYHKMRAYPWKAQPKPVCIMGEIIIPPMWYKRDIKGFLTVFDMLRAVTRAPFGGITMKMRAQKTDEALLIGENSMQQSQEQIVKLLPKVQVLTLQSHSPIGRDVFAQFAGVKQLKELVKGHFNEGLKFQLFAEDTFQRGMPTLQRWHFEGCFQSDQQSFQNYMAVVRELQWCNEKNLSFIGLDFIRLYTPPEIQHRFMTDLYERGEKFLAKAMLDAMRRKIQQRVDKIADTIERNLICDASANSVSFDVFEKPFRQKVKKQFEKWVQGRKGTLDVHFSQLGNRAWNEKFKPDLLEENGLNGEYDALYLAMKAVCSPLGEEDKEITKELDALTHYMN